MSIPENRVLESAPRELLTIEKLRRSAIEITSNGAVAAFKIIERVYQGSTKKLTKTDLDALKIEIDNASVADYKKRLNNADYTSDIVCEGAKEEAKYGPEAAVDIIRGPHGPAHLRVGNENSDVAGIIDPVEGTRPTAANEIGGTSFFVGSKGGKVREIPGEDKASYFNRIAGPARLKSHISVDNSPTQNIGAVCGAFGVSGNEVTVVVLDRPRNQTLIDELWSTRANLVLIKECDFMPAFFALSSDKPMLSYGAGGKEEGWATAMLAKKFGAAFDGQLVDKEGNNLADYPELLTPDDILIGSPESIYTSVSSITGDKWFNLKRIIQKTESNRQAFYRVETISAGDGPPRIQREFVLVPVTN